MGQTKTWQIHIAALVVSAFAGGCSADMQSSNSSAQVAAAVEMPRLNSNSASEPPRPKSGSLSDRRIVGGTTTSIRQHPWQVALQVTDAGGVALCGGSLVSPKWVLTAAHCFPSSAAAAQVRIKAGATNYIREGTWTSVERIVRHDGYNSHTQENDIALVKLSAATSGRPIPLVQSNDSLAEGQVLEVTGWGQTTEGGEQASLLQMVKVPLVSTATCNKADSYNNQIKSGMLCAGAKKGGSDACQGDSGGPLVSRRNSGPLLVGIVSFGEGCARKLKYGVYTSIASYRSWIDRIVASDPP